MQTGKRIISILLYVMFLLILFEGSARLCFFIPPIADRLQYEEDATWRRLWIEKHKTGAEIFYSFDAFDPTKGWISKPNIRNMEVFDHKILNTNSRGLRGKQEFSYEKHSNKIRILILGDSFTFGDQVSDNETYSYYLQKMIPDAEVINMGVHGYGHDQMLIYLKEEGVKYKPDIVILGFLSMDMSRNILQFRDYAKPKFVLTNDSIRITGYPIPRPEDILQWNWIRPRLYDIWLILKHKANVRSGLFQRQINEVTKRILGEMALTIYKADAVPIFIYMPDKNEFSNQKFLTEGERLLFSYCNEKNIAYCFSTRSYFVEKMNQEDPLNRIGHWTPFEHFTVAKAIYEYLTDQNLLSLHKINNNIIHTH
jgi:hypothetical protein